MPRITRPLSSFHNQRFKAGRLLLHIDGAIASEICDLQSFSQVLYIKITQNRVSGASDVEQMERVAAVPDFHRQLAKES